MEAELEQQGIETEVPAAPALATDTPPPEPATPAEPVNWQAEAEQLRQEREDWNKERDELRALANEEYETRLRLEGHVRAAGQTPAARTTAPTQAGGQEDGQQQFQQELMKQYQWVHQTLVPLVGSANAETKKAFVDALVHDDGPAGAWDIIENYVTNKVVGLLAANNLNTAELIRSHTQQTATSLLDDRSSRANQASVVNATFHDMYTKTHPHLGRYYSTLNPHGGAANSLQLAFATTACEIADNVAQQMMNRNDIDRTAFVHLLKEQGRSDVLQEYLSRVSSGIERAFGIAAAAVAPAKPAAPARPTPPAPGITPSGRGASRGPDIGTETEIDEDPVGSLIKERVRL